MIAEADNNVLAVVGDNDDSYKTEEDVQDFATITASSFFNNSFYSRFGF